MKESMMEEDWRDVVGQEGRYLVSKAGGVRSLLRRPEGEEYTAKVVSLYGGKRVVYFCINGKQRRFRVDRLVQQAFSVIGVDKAVVNTQSMPSPYVEQEAMKMILALKELGPVIDLNDTKQALYACSLVKELLTRRLT